MTKNKRTMIKDSFPKLAGELLEYSEKSLGGLTGSAEGQALQESYHLKSLFFSDDWVYIIIDLIAQKISSQPLIVMNKTLVDGKIVLEQDYNNNIAKLFEQPNQYQDYSAFMYSVACELFLMGNSIIWKGKRTGQLIALQTENVSLDVNVQDSKLLGYRLHGSHEEDGLGIREVQQIFKAEEIAHIRRPNPSSLFWGLSPFVAGYKSILFNRYSQEYLNSFYQRQATPAMALKLDRSVNEDVALRQLRSFELAYQGRRNQRKTLILPKGVDLQVLSHSLGDQKLIDHINLNRETILALLKVPKHELGLQTAGSLGSEEYKTALKNFWESTLIPATKTISGIFTKFFQKELTEDKVLQFDLSGVDALKEDFAKKAGLAKSMLEAGYSINEVRSEIWQIDAFEDANADKPYILVSQNQNNNFQLPIQTENKSLVNNVVTKILINEEIELTRKIIVKQLEQEEKEKIDVMLDETVNLLVGMTAKAIDVILQEDKKTKKSKKITYKELPSKRVLGRRISRVLKDEFEESWISTTAKTLTSSVDLGYSQQLDIVLNEEDRTAIEVLRDRDKDKRLSILEERGLESFAQISKTHTEKIIGVVADKVDNNESITNIARAVADELGTPDNIVSRAEKIARTETLTAVSIGQASAISNASKVIKGLKKVWLTSGDSRVRDSHQSLDGDELELNEKFANGLRYPRDTKNGDASDKINCRCTIFMKVPPRPKN